MINSIGSLSITELKQEFHKGTVSPVDAVSLLINDIEKYDNDVCSYLSIDKESALKAAADADISKPLGGIPIAIKDLINVKGQPCSCASQMLKDSYIATYDATAIANLKSHGAIPFGRLNMDEFAMGSTTENSGFHITKNPWDHSRIPGGSSGGSAACVANGTAIASLGSDTGGSIRQPASYCGVVGLKPSYGTVSRYGLVAFASSLDQIGPITKSSADAAVLLSAIAGKDPLDSTSIDNVESNPLSKLNGDIKGFKIGIPKEYFTDGMDSNVSNCINDAIKTLESLGAEIIEISLPHTDYAVSTYYIIATAEASANLARFDSVRYGHRAQSPNDIIDQYKKSRSHGFGQEVKRRIILGTYVLSSGYNDAYYVKAQKVRTLIRDDFTRAFDKVDAIVSPTAPTTACKIGEMSDDPLEMYLADIFTLAANLSGICGVSTPCGFVDTDENKKLPVGLQILGPPMQESKILCISDAYEKATNWLSHKARQ
ncbi:MAG: Asp-tRNA(Asn)/Glu-tRNA(Gln) amidotransferase GatCAB subunit A [Verrucomicrobiales bacterium]|nr:Asp-tRNA(Asn)/Glu-tRNA(Gln) amidotransferase GatCAB subunit A [Verrucomicrobiales bacterium]|tara:strand:- start:24239 stop:25699 length:1461 start_codon:yes stop_codon:yes gene_type:complete